MTSGVSDVKVDNTSVVTSGIANINTFTGATTSANGTKGLVPAPEGASQINEYYLNAKGEWLHLEPTTATTGGSLHIGIKYGNASDLRELPTATTSVDGTMSAADKTKLDSITMTNGIIDSSVLPSFVDDVIEAYARANQTELGSTWLATGSASGTVITPETGKIYVLMNDSTSYSANSQFRWGGTAYVKLNDGGVTEITNAEIDTIVAS